MESRVRDSNGSKGNEHISKSDEMKIESLTKDDWEWLAGKAEVRQTFGVDSIVIVEKDRRLNLLPKGEVAMGEELSQNTYGGKFVHSPSMIENKEQNGRTGYILFRDIPDEPLVVWRD